MYTCILICIICLHDIYLYTHLFIYVSYCGTVSIIFSNYKKKGNVYILFSPFSFISLSVFFYEFAGIPTKS